MSSFVESIKNAVVPDAAVTSNPQPENDIPGAFPDSDDEQEVEKHIQTNLAQGVSESTRRERDSNPTTTANATTTTLPDRTRREPQQGNAADRDFVFSNESLGLSPDKHLIPRSESMVHHRGSRHTGSELPEPANNNDEATAEKRAREEERAVAAEVAAAAGALASEQQQQPQQQSGFAMADKKTTSQVRPQHLGNEGATPPPRSPTTGEVKEERPAGQAQAQAAPASSTVDADSASASLGQYSGTGSSGLDNNNNNKLKAPGNGGIRNGVLGRGDSHLGPHLGMSRPARPGEQDQKNRSPAAAATGETNPAAGVDNSTVRDEDVIEEERPNEGRRSSRSSAGSSGSKKTRAEAVHLSGVSDSGLGLGGVHNGVVGHGSHDEEDTRHSTSSEAVQQPASTTA